MLLQFGPILVCGGHIADTLLFEAWALSIRCVFSKKNLNDVESNFVDGNITWVLQKSYARIMTTVCLNLVKGIFKKYGIFMVPSL